jgi:hypothetical protein
MMNIEKMERRPIPKPEEEGELKMKLSDLDYVT